MLDQLTLSSLPESSRPSRMSIGLLLQSSPVFGSSRVFVCLDPLRISRPQASRWLIALLIATSIAETSLSSFLPRVPAASRFDSQVEHWLGLVSLLGMTDCLPWSSSSRPTSPTVSVPVQAQVSPSLQAVSVRHPPGRHKPRSKDPPLVVGNLSGSS